MLKTVFKAEQQYTLTFTNTSIVEFSFAVVEILVINVLLAVDIET